MKAAAGPAPAPGVPVSGHRIAGLLLIAPAPLALGLGHGVSAIPVVSFVLGVTLLLVRETWLSELVRALVLLRSFGGIALAVYGIAREDLWEWGAAVIVYCASIAALMLDWSRQAQLVAIGAAGFVALLVTAV